ncbi:DUF262 domain-containing protein [Roseateles sp.]|uniref:DUF262 domain-containing protein n=1 Tax=Roseateles sp. TaxID=1971397 RepID=UPI002F4016F2
MSVQDLQSQLNTARRQVVTDGYDMSLGEIASLYRNKELVIDPNYQRLFRWEESQKTRFIESILLGIPVPPVFVFQRENGVWELIDGLQRISTVLQLTGDLLTPEGAPYERLVLGGTNLLPALAGMKWEGADGTEDDEAFNVALQLEIKRARMRVEILRKESDQDTKFELFQRLNTGGSKLSEQEVRNSVLVMINPEFFAWMARLTEIESFRETVQLTDSQRRQQQHVEMALRFIAYRRHPYARGLDVNEYLDDAARKLAHLTAAEMEEERDLFRWVFDTLRSAEGPDVFKRWDGERHTGKFLISGFDAIAFGVALNRRAIEDMEPEAREAWLTQRVRSLWSEPRYVNNSGMGVRGTTRLTHLLPFGRDHFSG